MHIAIFFGVSLLASAPAGSPPADAFKGRQAKEILSSTLSVAEAERCIVASGVSAYPVRLGSDRQEIVFFLTLQTLSGRNPPAWRLTADGEGSSLAIYDGRRYFRSARKCFQPFASDRQS